MGKEGKKEGDKMKKLLTTLALALLAFTLSACDNNDSKPNTISEVDLTERENAILSTTADQSFVFDFNIDSDYQEASIWIEKYESGELVDDKISHITTEIKDNGSIIFATSGMDKTQNEHTFNIGINSNGSTGTIRNKLSVEGYENMSSMWGSIQGEINPTEGELALASICYTSEGGMSSLSSDFYEDVDGHINELEEYDVAFLLRAEFTK